MEFGRFFAVALAGLALDIAIAWGLATVFAVPLWLAAAVGFTVAAAANYALHELWTFRGGARTLSLRRLGKYLLTACAALAVRVAAVATLDAAVADQSLALPILLVGAGLSFAVNFAASKWLVFGTPDAVSDATPGGPAPPPWQVPDHETDVFAARAHRHALVIPVINEGERIRGQLRRIAAAGMAVDVVVADGGSTDGSLDPDFLRQAGVRALLTKTGAGRLGAQLRMAYAWCLDQGYEGIVTIDGNGKDGVEAVSEMVAKLDAGFDYVQGSRYLPGGQAENTPLERTIGNRLIHAPLLSLAGRHRFSDTTNGFRAYSARYLRDPRVQPFRDVFRNYELLFYLTVRAGQIGMKVTQVPVRRVYPDTGGTPTKITGVGAKAAVLAQTLDAATGAFAPARADGAAGGGWLAVACFAAVVACLFLAFRTAPPYSPDSWAYLELSQTVFGDFFRVTHLRSFADDNGYSSSFPPLWPVLIAMFESAFRTGPYAPFHLALLTFVAFAAVSEAVGRQAFGARWLGLGLAVLMLADPQALREEIAAGRSIPLQMLLLALILLVLLRARPVRPAHGLVLGLLSGLAVMNRFDAIFLPALLAVWIALRHRALAAAGLCAAAAAAVCLPWVVYSLHRFGKPFATDNAQVAGSLDPAAFVTDWWPEPRPTLSDDPVAWLGKVAQNSGGLLDAALGVLRQPAAVTVTGFVLAACLWALLSRRAGADPSGTPPGGVETGIAFRFMGVALAILLLPQLTTGYFDARYFAPLFWTLAFYALGTIAAHARSGAQRAVFGGMAFAVMVLVAVASGLSHAALWPARGFSPDAAARAAFAEPAMLPDLLRCLDGERPGRIWVVGDDTLAARLGAQAGIPAMMEPRNIARGALDADGIRAFADAFGVEHVLLLREVRTDAIRQALATEAVTGCALPLYRVEGG